MRLVTFGSGAGVLTQEHVGPSQLPRGDPKRKKSVQQSVEISGVRSTKIPKITRNRRKRAKTSSQHLESTDSEEFRRSSANLKTLQDARKFAVDTTNCPKERGGKRGAFRREKRVSEEAVRARDQRKQELCAQEKEVTNDNKQDRVL